MTMRAKSIAFSHLFNNEHLVGLGDRQMIIDKLVELIISTLVSKVADTGLYEVSFHLGQVDLLDLYLESVSEVLSHCGVTMVMKDSHYAGCKCNKTMPCTLCYVFSLACAKKEEEEEEEDKKDFIQ